MVGQRDLGSSLLFFTLFVVMMWVATERVSYLVIGRRAVRRSPPTPSWRMFGHVQTRVDIWLDPWSRPLDKGYQIVQALYGIADGGVAGTGLGLGSPDKIPEAQNDFIFAAIGEELGLFGATAVLMAYLLIIGAGLRIALRTDRTFEKLLAVGLTTIIGVQAFIIIGGVIKVVPLTGITLPFVSYGGSSLLANYILLALLMRLSDSGARRLGELPDDPTPRERWAAWRLRRRERRHDRDRCRLARLVNRQIRQLAAALIACYVVLFAALNYWQVGRQEELDAQPDNTRPAAPRVRPAARPDRHRRRRDRRPLRAAPRPTATSSTAPVPDRRPVRQRHRLLHVRPRLDAARATQNDVLTGDTPSSSCAPSPASSPATPTRRASVQLTLRNDLQQIAKDPLGDRGGLGRRARADDRRGPGDVELPELRPQPDRRPRLRRRPRRASPCSRPTRAIRCSPTPTSSATCRARRSRCSPRASPSRTASSTSTASSPTRASSCRRRPTDPIENYGGTLCGGDLAEVFTRSCNTPFAQTAVDLGPERLVDGRRAMGRRRADPDRPAPRRRRARSATRRTSTRTCRCWRSAASARTRTRWCRCTWRWSPPRSPTAAR